MHKFPFPLHVVDYMGKPYFGYYNPAGIFSWQGACDSGWIPPELTQADADYLDELNSLLTKATGDAIARLNMSVLPYFDPCPRNDGYFNDSDYFNQSKNQLTIRRLVAKFMATEMKHQSMVAQKETRELAARYDACLTMSDPAYAKLMKTYGGLAIQELRMLVEHALADIDSHLPDYAIAMRTLKWDRRLLDQLERNGNMLRFYGMLKEFKKKHLR